MFECGTAKPSFLRQARQLYKCHKIVVIVLFSSALTGTIHAAEPIVKQSTKDNTEPASIASKTLLNLFEVREYSCGSDTGHKQKFRYRLFKPVGKVQGSKFPLIVWLHGYGEDELQLIDVGQLKYVEPLIIKDPSNPEKYPFFFLAVQCPHDNDRWFVADSTNTAEHSNRITPGEATIEIISSLLKSEPIDANRVYLNGICDGGTSALTMAARRPDLFAAIACFSANSINDDSLKKLVNIPIWAFRNRIDSPEILRRVIDRLKQMGGHCAFTETQLGNHDSWSEAFIDCDIFDWQMSQRRGQPDRDLPPGTSPLRLRWRQFKLDYAQYLSWSQLRPRLITIGGFVSIIWLCRRELRRRRPVKTSACA